MKPSNPSGTTPIIAIKQPCDRCPHNAANANLGQQIMQHISQLTPAERGQMLALIDQILTASHQQN